MLAMAFLPRLTEGRLEIRHDGVLFIPRGLDRFLSGEEVTQAAVSPQSTEILLCHSFLESMHVGYGVIVRGPHEREQEVRLKFLRQPDAHDCHGIANDLIKATGLPVRLVIRRSTSGIVHESPWTPIAPQERRVLAVALLTSAALPYIGGITVGILRLRVPVIAAVGVVLWIGQIVGAYFFARRRSTSKEIPSALLILSTIFTFGMAYGLGVVCVPIFREHA